MHFLDAWEEDSEKPLGRYQCLSAQHREPGGFSESLPGISLRVVMA
jgi:hypothetical protein